MRPIKLLLVDDHQLFRESLSRLLASEEDFVVAGQCGSSDEALAILNKSAVDVVLLDFDLGNELGNSFIISARQAGFEGRILMVTAEMNAAESSKALQQGVSGILLKHNPPAILAKAIRAIAKGEMWVDPKIIHAMADGVQHQLEPNPSQPLTERETQVLQGVLEGLTNKEIASHLQVSDSSVKSTLQQLFQKTHVRTRSQLVRISLEGSLIPKMKS